MTSSLASKFISAVEDAEIKNYYFVTDSPTNLCNNENGIIILNGDTLININKPTYAHYRSMNGVEIATADIVDIHEARAIGTAEQIKAVAEALGASISDEQYKIICNFDKMNVDLKPITGDYKQFVFLTATQYNALSDEEKAAYDEAKQFKGELHGFKYLYQQEYDWLSDEDKASYDQVKSDYEKAKEKSLGINQAASISFK